MCVYVCSCVYMSMSAPCEHICACMREYIHVDVCLMCGFKHMCVLMCAHVCEYVCMHVCACVRAYVCAPMHAHVLIRVHVSACTNSQRKVMSVLFCHSPLYSLPKCLTRREDRLAASKPKGSSRLSPNAQDWDYRPVPL